MSLTLALSEAEGKDALAVSLRRQAAHHPSCELQDQRRGANVRYRTRERGIRP